MADNIVGNLFGVDLESLQKAQEAAGKAEDFKIAQLDPFQAQRYQMAQAGRGIGQGINSLLGLQDPELAKQAKENSVLQDVQASLSPEDLQDPVKLSTAVFQAAQQAGLPDLANHAYNGLQQAQLQKAKIGQENATAAKANMEMYNKANELKQQQDLTTALKSLPADASEDDYMNVVRRFGAPKDIMASIDKRQLATEARTAKHEDLVYKADQDMQRARERNDTLLQQARLQGANAQQLQSMKLQGDIMIQTMKDNSAKEIAQLKAQNDALNKGLPKDVAEASAAITGLDLTLKSANDLKTKLDNGQVIFSPKENAITFASMSSGYPTENALAQTEVKRTIKEGVNTILVQAKGTQTEGDAKRAQELYLAAEGSNSTKAWQAAMNALIKTQERFKAEKNTYIKVRGFSDKVSSTSDNDPLGIRK